MKSYKIRTADVEVNLTPVPSKVPRKLIVGKPGQPAIFMVEDQSVISVEPFTVIDRESVEVKEKPEGGFIVKAWDSAENREVIDMWRKIKAFEGREIQVGSRDDDEYSKLEICLNKNTLGQVLLRCISLETEVSPVEVAEEILGRQELAKDWAIISKYLDYDTEKHKFVWQPNLDLLFAEKRLPKAKPETKYYCSKCNMIFDGSELEFNLCPRCQFILSETLETHLWQVNASMVSKRVRCKTVIAGEGEAKAVYVKWTAECGKCGLKIEIDFSSPELKLPFFETLISKGSFGLSDAANILKQLPSLGHCEKGSHSWRIAPEETPVNYREVSLRDDLSFEEAMDKSVITRNYPVILFGDIPESQRINISGMVIINPKNNVLTLVVDSYDEASPIKSAALTPQDIEMIKKYFNDREELKEWLDFVEPKVCPKISGRPEAKMASLLTINSPLWVSVDGVTPTPSVLKCLFVGDKRCGKGSIIRWWSEVIGIGEHGSGETSSRAGVGYYVDTESNTIVWGLLPQADRGVALIEALHGLSADQMLEFREILVNMKVEVRKRVSGCRWARTRILADANPPMSLRQRVYPCLVIPALRCFLDPIDITRWDLFIPFGEFQVPEEDIAEAWKRIEDSDFINALRKLVSWVWSLRMDQIQITGEAMKKITDIAIELMRSYRFEEVPLIHNGSMWQLLRLACSFAALSFNTPDGEALKVEARHVDLAEEFLRCLLGMWKLSECLSQMMTKPLTEEKFNEIKAYVEKSDVAMKILDVIAVKPMDGMGIAGRIEHGHAYVRRVLGEMRQLGLVDRKDYGYVLTIIGVDAYRRLRSQSQPSLKESLEQCLGFFRNPENDVDQDGWIEVEHWVAHAEARGIPEPKRVLEVLREEGKVLISLDGTKVQCV